MATSNSISRAAKSRETAVPTVFKPSGVVSGPCNLDADYQAMLAAERRDARLARACLLIAPLAATFGLLHLGYYVAAVLA